MNPFEMMKNFGDMKKQLENAQAELSKITATGAAGGNMVVITMNGNFEVLDIKLDPICVDNRDVPMLQDLIKAAHHNALEKIQEQIKSNAGSMLSGMNIPGMNI